MNCKTVVSREPRVIAKAVGGNTVLFLGERGMVHQLDTVASSIWELIDGQRNAAEIARCLADVYDVDEEVATTDVVELLSQMLAEGIVEEARDGAVSE